MKQFNTLSELAQAKVLTGTPVRIMTPLIDGMVQATGEGLSLASGNVFVPRFEDQEAITGRKTSLLDDAFTGNLSTRINRYKKTPEGTWIADANGRTSTVYYNGQIWWSNDEVSYTANGYLVQSWGFSTSDPDVLELQVTGSSEVIQFTRYNGLSDRGQVAVGTIVSEEAPQSPVTGQRWTRCTDMKSFIWYVDGDSQQWIEDNPSMGADFPDIRADWKEYFRTIPEYLDDGEADTGGLVFGDVYRTPTGEVRFKL